jgi:hypothetical protein
MTLDEFLAGSDVFPGRHAAGYPDETGYQPGRNDFDASMVDVGA